MQQSPERHHSEFELRVDFTGLCLFVRHPRDPGRIAVLMPDARMPFAESRLKHTDGSPAVSHVGYVRFDLANLSVREHDGIVPAAEGVSPSYEVVHRFDRETLSFGLPPHDEPAIENRLALPTFDEFAEGYKLKHGLFSDDPPTELLFRMTLQGGAIESIVEHRDWAMVGESSAKSLARETAPHSTVSTRQYGGLVRWTLPVRADELTLRLVPFDGRRRHIEIPLRPTRLEGDIPAIALKIANLCATNPLEWDELDQRAASGPDTDFKWLYHLLKSPPPAHGHMIARVEPLVPTPILGPTENEGIMQDCFSGVITDEWDGNDN